MEPAPVAAATPSRPRAAEPALLGALSVAFAAGAALMPLCGATMDCVATATGLAIAALAWRWPTAGYPAFVHHGRRVDPALDVRRRRWRQALWVLLATSAVAAAIDRPAAVEGAGGANNVSVVSAVAWAVYGLAATLAVVISSARSSRLVSRLLRAPAQSVENGTWGAAVGEVRSGVGVAGSAGAALAIVTEEFADLTMPTLVRESVLAGDGFRLDLPSGVVDVNPAAAHWASDVRVYPGDRADGRVQLVRAEMIPDGARVLASGVLRGQPGARRLEAEAAAPMALFACAPGGDPRAVLHRKVTLRRAFVAALLAALALNAATYFALRPRLPPVHSPWAS